MTRKARRTSAERLKVIRRLSTVENLEPRCLLTIFNLQIVQPQPGRLPVEGNSYGANSPLVATFASNATLANLTSTPPVVTFPTSTTATITPAPNGATETVNFNGVTQNFPEFFVNYTGTWVPPDETGGTPASNGVPFTVQVTDATPVTGNTSQAAGSIQVLDAALTVTPSAAPSPTAGTQLNPNPFPVATLTDAAGGNHTGDFTGTIDWGDGTPVSAATFINTGSGTYNVVGTHTYTTARAITGITVSVLDKGGQSATGSTAGFTVGPAAITASSLVPVVGTEGQTLVSVPVATFTDANPQALAGDFITSIDWGDSTTVGSGSVVRIGTAAGGGSLFAVTGTHTYATASTTTALPTRQFSMTVTIQDRNSGVVTTLGPTANALISPGSLGVTVLPITAVENVATPSPTTGMATSASDGLIATFTDAGGPDVLANYSATVDWGDGTTDTTAPGGTLTIKSLDNGQSNQFGVYGTHTYTKPGIDRITATVNDLDPATGVGGNIAVVLPASIISLSAANAAGALDPGFEGQPLVANAPPPLNNKGTQLATFVVDAPGQPASNYSVLIDWGDGSPQSAGQVFPDLAADAVPPFQSHFIVTGEHTYAEPKLDALGNPINYTITVYITQNGPGGIFGVDDSTVHVQDTIVILDAKLQPGEALPVFGTEDQPLNDVPVATFYDENPNATAADFTASIDWGDGSLPVPDLNTRIQLIGGVFANPVTGAPSSKFAVYGSHVYQSPGTFATEVSITDRDGEVAQVNFPPVAGGNTLNVTISQSPVVVTVFPLAATLDAPVADGTRIATFVDQATSDNPTPGGDYTATIDWGDGLPTDDGTIEDLGGGQFAVLGPVGGHSYGSVGSFVITVHVHDADPADGFGANLAIVQDSVITVFPAADITDAVEGQPLNGGAPVTVALLTDSDPFAGPLAYSALIDWGDGSPQSAGTIVPDTAADTADPTAAHFFVQGTHTYAEETAPGQTYRITVVVQDNFGGKDQDFTLVTGVADADLAAGTSYAIFATEDQPLNDVPVATFTDANPLATAADFTATINWGDGSVPADNPDTRIVLVGGGPDGAIFAVYGSHVYKTTGTFSTSVNVTDVGGVGHATITGEDNVTVAQQPILVSGLPIGVFTLDKATPADLPVATFLDTASSDDPLTNYSAMIDWGDGTAPVSATSIEPLGGGQFKVLAPSHTYHDTGSFPVTVTVNDTDPAMGIGGNLAIVVNSVIVATPAPAPILNPDTGKVTNEGEPLVNVELATLTDTDTSAVAGDYTVQIDWGDGSPQSAGTVIADPTADAADPTHAHFIIQGSHTYAETNLAGYKVQLIVTDAFGGKTTATDLISVADAKLSDALGLPIFATKNVPLDNIPVATFIDANTLGTVGDFFATINWGDGSPLDHNARVALVGANPAVGGTGLQYAVFGSHVYSTIGAVPYLTEITITDIDGSSISTTPGVATVSVNSSPLVITASPVTATEGIALPNAQTIPTAAGAQPTVIATFHNTTSADPIGDYSVLIDWGNGKPGTPSLITTGTIIQNGLNFVIIAPATPAIVYPEEGNYTIRIALTDSNGGEVAYAIDPVIVADATLTAGTTPTITPVPSQGTPLAPTPGLTPPSTALGTFTDANPLGNPDDFNATIDWGDGTAQSAGFITQTGQSATSSGLFTVSGNHTYASPSTTAGFPAGYPVTIYVKDVGGSSVTLHNLVVVNASTIVVTPLTFNAVEGQPVTNVVVATFTDSGTPGPISSYSATINWNEGTPGTTTQGQIVLLGGNTFQILGSLPSGYPEEGTFNVFVSVFHNGTAVTGNPFTATAKVADAPLSGTATPIVAQEGTPFTGVIGNFTDLDPGGVASDYTVTINWGDGTAPVTVPGTAVLSQPGGPGTPFIITVGGAGHLYTEEGPTTLTISVVDHVATFTASEEVFVNDTAPVPVNPQPTIAVNEGVLFSGPVATFKEIYGTFAEPITDFTATIDWGDGSAQSVGTIVATGTPGVYQVAGTHVFQNLGFNIGGTAANPTGTFNITVIVHDDGGSNLVIPNTATVNEVPIIVTASLTASSDSGKFHDDGVTNINQPTFTGTTEPFAHVQLFATPTGGGSPFLIGQTEALSDGSFSITTSRIPDGSYTITATGQDQAGLPKAPAIFPVTTATGNSNVLTIDTVGPRVTNATFNRFNGTITMTFSDFGGSGLLAQSLQDSANFGFNNQRSRPLGKYIVDTLTVAPGSGRGEQTVSFTIAQTTRGAIKPSRLLRGFFQVVAHSASVLNRSGIQDLAGNGLDGEYYGPSSASGNGVVGGDFVANLNDFHNITQPPNTVIGFPHPNDPAGHFRTRTVHHHARVGSKLASSVGSGTSASSTNKWWSGGGLG
jgi:hypothetical protein